MISAAQKNPIDPAGDVASDDYERRRQAALDRYRILDTDAEVAFDDLAKLASTICGTSSAVISLVDRDRQWFKARVGCARTGTARSESLCDHAIRSPRSVMEVRDLWPESIVAYGALQRGSALHKVLTALEAWLYRNAERIIVVTDGWEEHFASLGIDPAKLQVIPNGTEPKDFIVDADRETLRREYGIDGTTAIFAGSHGPKDGIPLILNAAAKLDGINFVLIGDGSAKDEAIAEAKARNLTNVEFRDPIPKSELPRLLRACDVGLHVVAPLDVFNKGMSPNKLFDYLASDLPVVTNARIPLQRVISDDEVGAVVDPDDIATGITRVLAADQSTRERWRAHAQMLMSTKYSRDAASRLLEQLLDEVVAGVPPRSAKA